LWQRITERPSEDYVTRSLRKSETPVEDSTTAAPEEDTEVPAFVRRRSLLENENQ
jgi:hypothetical protein